MYVCVDTTHHESLQSIGVHYLGTHVVGAGFPSRERFRRLIRYDFVLGVLLYNKKARDILVGFLVSVGVLSTATSTWAFSLFAMESLDFRHRANTALNSDVFG